MLAAAVIVPVVCVPIYQSATKLLASWDGGNEEMSDTIDEKLSIVLWVTSAAFILSYFLIAASYANGFETFKTETSGALFLAGIIGFLTIMIEAVIFQQKCVDTTKKMNPEKTASVYDTKFPERFTSVFTNTNSRVIWIINPIDIRSQINFHRFRFRTS